MDLFLRKLFSVMLAGFAAACLIWFVRHIVEAALYENGAGWQEMFKK